MNRMDKTTGDFFHLTSKQGLPDEVVYGILADNAKNIWGSTNNGIFCLLDNPPFTPPAFPISPGNWGAWETTGVVDASAAFGPGSFLINIQAHTLWVEKAPGPDNNGDGIPDFTYKREGGQLLLLKIPGI